MKGLLDFRVCKRPDVSLSILILTRPVGTPPPGDDVLIQAWSIPAWVGNFSRFSFAEAQAVGCRQNIGFSRSLSSTLAWRQYSGRHPLVDVVTDVGTHPTALLGSY